MMMTQQLRRWTDKVDADMLRRWSDKAGDGLKVTGEAAKNGFNTAYSKAINNPKAATAVVLGASVAAAVLWLARQRVFTTPRQVTPKRISKRRASSARRG